MGGSVELVDGGVAPVVGGKDVVPVEVFFLSAEIVIDMTNSRLKSQWDWKSMLKSRR